MLRADLQYTTNAAMSKVELIFRSNLFTLQYSDQ